MKTKMTLLFSFVFFFGMLVSAQNNFDIRYQEDVANDHFGKALNEANTEVLRLDFNPSTCDKKLDDASFKQVTLKNDKVLLVLVKSIPGSGFQWMVKGAKNDALKLVRNEPAPGNGPSQIVDTRIAFTALKKGVSQVQLEYRRVWENKAPLKTYTIEVNSEGAFTGKFEVPEKVNSLKAKLTEADYKVKALPSYYNLYDQGNVTSVKDQGSTNGCWAFGSAGSFESAVKVSTGATIDVAEQWLCNCNSYGFSCVNGGWFAAYMFVDYGAVYESQEPFYSSGYDGTCGTYTYHEQATSWGYTDGVSDSPWPNYSHNASTTQIKQAIYDHGALAANVYIGNSWYSYTSGILTTNDGQWGHIITLVGWDDANNCWIIKNSWGTNWGESGYCRSDYSLTSINVGGYSTWVDMTGTNPTTCDIPTGLTESNITSTSARLNWNYSTGAADYTVAYRESGVTTWTNVTTSYNYYDLTGLTAGSTYEWGIEANCSGGGVSGFSPMYTFTTTGGSTCDIPTGLSESNITETSARLNWSYATGAADYTVAYRESGVTTWTNVTTSYNYYDLSGLTANTTYEWGVESNCSGGGVSGFSTMYTFTTTGSTPSNYCASQGSDFSYEWISSVQIGSFSNSSSAAGYTDFTNQTVSVNSGSNSVTLTPGFSSSSYTEFWTIWIDLNQNSTFDSNEELFSGSGSSTVSGSMNIPSGYSGVTTRMRITMKYNAAPTACETFSYGEVEDYTVTVGGTTQDTQAPTAPTNLSSTGVTETSVSLIWNPSSDNVGVTGYDVYRGSTNVGTASSTSYTVTGLSAGTQYSFSVRAKDAAGNVSGSSNTINVTTSTSQDTQAPTTPSGLYSPSSTTTTIDLSWNPSSDNVGVEGYDIYRNSSFAGTTASTSFTATGLNPNTSYNFYVIAKDAAGNESSASNSISASTLADQGNCITSFPFSESFESGIGQFTQGTGDDTDWVNRSGSTPSSSTGPSGANDGSYYMYIESSSPNYPSKVANFISPCFDFSGMNTPALEFMFHMYGSGMGTLNVQASNNGSSWTTLWSMSGDQGNSWQAATVDLSSFGGQSNVQIRFNGTTGSNYRSDMCIDKFVVQVGTNPTDTEPPTTPTGLYVSGTSSSSISIGWDPSSDNVGVTGYDVFMDNSFMTTTSSTIFTATGLSQNSTHTFYVIAKDAAGNESGASSSISGTTTSTQDTQAPTTPTGLTASGETSSTIDLSWNASSDNVGVTGYDIFRNSSFVTTTSSTSYTVSGLTENTTYSFYVIAKDAAGNESSASNSVSATTTGGSTVTYCSSQSNNVTYEWIAGVQFGSFNNTSDAQNYSDFTNQAVTMSAGSNVSVTLTPGFRQNEPYTEAWSVWIDYNKNGSFDDSGEQVFTNSGSQSAVSGNFNVSSSAAGTTRMRVSMKYNGMPSSCESFTYGEVEDYTVNFGATAPNPLAKTEKSDITVKPNPTDGNFTLVVPGLKGDATMNVFNMTGQNVFSQSITLDGQPVEVPVSLNVAPGIYTVQVVAGELAFTKQVIVK